MICKRRCNWADANIRCIHVSKSVPISDHLKAACSHDILQYVDPMYSLTSIYLDIYISSAPSFVNDVLDIDACNCLVRFATNLPVPEEKRSKTRLLLVIKHLQLIFRYNKWLLCAPFKSENNSRALSRIQTRSVGFGIVLLSLIVAWIIIIHNMKCIYVRWIKFLCNAQYNQK